MLYIIVFGVFFFPTVISANDEVVANAPGANPGPCIVNNYNNNYYTGSLKSIESLLKDFKQQLDELTMQVALLAKCNASVSRNICGSDPCLNNGTCNEHANRFNCSCLPGFVGDRCQDRRNMCDSNPCLNNGTCNDEVNGFSCSCTLGFAGERCQDRRNMCDSDPCLNNGTCNAEFNGFRCSCTLGFAGERCQDDFTNTLNQFLLPVVGNNPKWLLCYRASTDGWKADTFHNRCDGKYNTVTVIKKGPYVFGGYSDIPWEHGGKYGATPKAFIFSLRNHEGLGPFKSTARYPGRHSIGRFPGFGPTFGHGHDIYIANNANNNTESYTNFGYHKDFHVPSGVQNKKTVLAGTYHFSPDEVEVFYLI